RGIELQEAVIDQPQKEQQQRSPNHSAIDRGGALAPFARLAEGKRNDSADQEYKERKNQVVEMETLPVPLCQLFMTEGLRRPADPVGDGLGEPFAPNDPEHVEAAEGVDGNHTFRSRAVRGRLGKCAHRGWFLRGSLLLQLMVQLNPWQNYLRIV